MTTIHYPAFDTSIEHAPAPDKGRNVHCTCGAEYSSRTRLMVHVETRNEVPEPEQGIYWTYSSDSSWMDASFNDAHLSEV